MRQKWLAGDACVPLEPDGAPRLDPFGRHPAPHVAVRIQDCGGGLSALTRARPKSEITV